MRWGRLGAARLELAAAAGLAHALSIAWPAGGQPLWWLQLASLGLLAWVLAGTASPWRAAGQGWAFATAWLAGVFWWLFISMHVYGGLPAWMAVLAVLGLAACVGLYTAAAAGLWVRLRPPGRPVASVALFAVLWLGAELLRATWFTGFPWGASGYAHVEGPLAALAPWIGVHGIAAVAGLLAASLALLARERARGAGWVAAGVAAVLAAAWAAGPVGAGLAPGPRLSVALLQGNIPQDEKFEGGSGVPQALQWYATQLRDARASLVVTPETAIPLLPSQLPEGYLQAIRQRFAGGTQAALVGIPLGSFEEGYTNSVLGFGPQEGGYRYDKHHLVPFGEFIPPLFRWFTQMMQIPLGDFNRGAVGQPSFAFQGQRLAPNVCYEDLFGEELAARFADPALAPTMFVNVSNIGWFGNTVAIDQHLQISRMRALEFARPMLRATNTGATVVIARDGRVTHALPRHTRGILVGEAEGGLGITPYAWWMARAGLWPLWGLVLLALALALRASGRGTRQHEAGADATARV